MPKVWKPTENQRDMVSPWGVDFYKQPQEWNLRMGAQRLPFRNQPEESSDGLYAPLTRVMVNHLNLMRRVIDDPELYAVLKARPDEWERRLRSAIVDLEKELQSLRKHLERIYGLWFYRTPTIEPKALNDGLIGLAPKAKAEGEDQREDATFKFFPLSVYDGKTLGMDDNSLKLIAKDVIYVLIQKKAAHGTMREERTLLRYSDGWMALLDDPRICQWAYAVLKDKVPAIVGSSATQLLLLG